MGEGSLEFYKLLASLAEQTNTSVLSATDPFMPDWYHLPPRTPPWLLQSWEDKQRLVPSLCPLYPTLTTLLSAGGSQWVAPTILASFCKLLKHHLLALRTPHMQMERITDSIKLLGWNFKNQVSENWAMRLSRLRNGINMLQINPIPRACFAPYTYGWVFLLLWRLFGGVSSSSLACFLLAEHQIRQALKIRHMECEECLITSEIRPSHTQKCMPFELSLRFNLRQTKVMRLNAGKGDKVTWARLGKL